MHVRFLSCIGLPVLDDSTQEHLGAISGVLIHPDYSRIEGFFTKGKGYPFVGDLFFSVSDIARWGVSVRVGSSDVLGPIEDRIRLKPLLSDHRPVLGQSIKTESGMRLGRCRDIQFCTKTFRMEWLFPKKWFRWRRAIPVSSIKEITEEAIIVNDPVLTQMQEQSKEVATQNIDDVNIAIPQPSYEGRA
jgi:uncharacterized protein YrrD